MTRHPSIKIGDRFGQLVVREREAVADRSGYRWLCGCDCGGSCWVRASDLRTRQISCGCFNRIKNVTHGGARTPLYTRWLGMIARCHNPSNRSYPRYGARGIAVCQEWRLSFEAFREYVGEPPAGMTLDRWPNQAGNYEPGNVRWATPVEQARNTRRNHLYTINGVTRCVTEWCEVLDIPYATVKARLRRGHEPFVELAARRKKHEAVA